MSADINNNNSNNISNRNTIMNIIYIDIRNIFVMDNA